MHGLIVTLNTQLKLPVYPHYRAGCASDKKHYLKVLHGKDCNAASSGQLYRAVKMVYHYVMLQILSTIETKNHLFVT